MRFIFLQMITPSGHLSQRAPWCSDSVVIFVFVFISVRVATLVSVVGLPIRRYPLPLR